MSLLFTKEQLSSMNFESKTDQINSTNPKTIKSEWVRLTCRIPTSDQLKAIGFLVSKEYRKIRGRSPLKKSVEYNGKKFNVNTYSDSDYQIIVTPLLKRLIMHPERVSKAQKQLSRLFN
jgi:hypothetical protein